MIRLYQYRIVLMLYTIAVYSYSLLFILPFVNQTVTHQSGQEDVEPHFRRGSDAIPGDVAGNAPDDAAADDGADEWPSLVVRNTFVEVLEGSPEGIPWGVAERLHGCQIKVLIGLSSMLVHG